MIVVVKLLNVLSWGVADFFFISTILFSKFSVLSGRKSKIGKWPYFRVLDPIFGPLLEADMEAGFEN